MLKSLCALTGMYITPVVGVPSKERNEKKKRTKQGRQNLLTASQIVDLELRLGRNKKKAP